jgi:hypothetical protein
MAGVALRGDAQAEDAVVVVEKVGKVGRRVPREKLGKEMDRVGGVLREDNRIMGEVCAQKVADEGAEVFDRVDGGGILARGMGIAGGGIGDRGKVG